VGSCRDDAAGGDLQQQAPKNSHRPATWPIRHGSLFRRCTGPCRNLALEVLMATGQCSESYDARECGLFRERRPIPPSSVTRSPLGPGVTNADASLAETNTPSACQQGSGAI
jgi:hypothetical protein